MLWRCLLLIAIGTLAVCQAAGVAYSDEKKALPQKRFDKLRNKHMAMDEALLSRLNARINAVPYVEDMKNYKVPDYWAAPEEFYRMGGDCEDYVIAKMHALHGYGVPFEDMRMYIVYLNDTETHALLAVILNNKTYVLDNRSNALYGPGYLASYRPGAVVEAGGKKTKKRKWP